MAKLILNVKLRAYHRAFPALIKDYRVYWHQLTEGLTNPALPFGIVGLETNKLQVDKIAKLRYKHAGTLLSYIRWGQTANYGYVPNAAMPNTFMAIATDVGDPTSPEGYPALWHVRYKRELGKRLALAALHMAYGWKHVYQLGPIATLAVRNGSLTEIHFHNVGEHGILIKRLRDCDLEVEVAAAWIPAYIESHTHMSVHVSHDGSGTPTRVRYSWSAVPCAGDKGPFNCTIYAKHEMLPAAPFMLHVTSV